MYYLNDATGYVRQGADEQGQVTSNWLFDPDGTVLEGPQGPVSHLICGGVYDWSTGLIFKGGRYFDPSLGIWLALTPLVVLQSWRGRKRKRRGMSWYVPALLFLFASVCGILVACGGEAPDTDFVKNICADTPEPGKIDLSVLIRSQPMARNTAGDQAWGDAWFVRLGEASANPEVVGVPIVGTRTFSKDSGVSGELKFAQYIASSRKYYFEEWENGSFKISDTYESAGGLHKLYQEGSFPISEYETYARSGSSEDGSTFWSYMLDAPGQKLEMANKEVKGNPLLAKLEREDHFQTFLLWYPVGISSPIPIAMVEWSWRVVVEAKPASGVGQWDYPLQWTVIDRGTDPQVGELKYATNINEQGLSLPEPEQGQWNAEDLDITTEWSTSMNIGRGEN